MMNNTIKIIISVIGCELVGILSIPFTLVSIPTWYKTLNKPFFSPPNWIFGPVWILLYFLMGISASMIWIKGIQNKKVKVALMMFLFQLGANFLWSILFFGFHSPFLAFLDIIVLWLALIITTVKFSELSRTAGYLLIPYIIWVTFASLLNFSIIVLNN